MRSWVYGYTPDNNGSKARGSETYILKVHLNVVSNTYIKMLNWIFVMSYVNI